MAWLLLILIYKLNTMKNNLKTTLFVLAGFTVLTVTAQQRPPRAARRSADVETGTTKGNNSINSNSNSVNDGKTMNATVPTKSASNATNLKGQNDVSATQSSSSKPAATTTSITSSKVTTSNTGSTTEKKGVETRGARKPK